MYMYVHRVNPVPPNGISPRRYDFFADVVPHVDRHNRKWEGPWYPKMGP